MNHEYLIDAFITKLQGKDISYAIITGKYEKLGVAEEKKERNFVEDLDIVFFDTTEEIIHRHLIEMGLKQISHHTYKFQKNGYELPVDIFIDFINSGYYYLFPIDKNNLTIKNNRICISEHDYILYQILEPLIKFSGYKKRHFIRLRKYFMNGFIWVGSAPRENAARKNVLHFPC